MDLATQITLAGLPAPTVEHKFHHKRRWRWDFCWPAYLVAVEIQGGTWSGGRHTRGSGYQNDCEKSREGQLLGWIVLGVTTKDVKGGKALDAIERALSLRGWQR